MSALSMSPLDEQRENKSGCQPTYGEQSSAPTGAFLATCSPTAAESRLHHGRLNARNPHGKRTGRAGELDLAKTLTELLAELDRRHIQHALAFVRAFLALVEPRATTEIV